LAVAARRVFLVQSAEDAMAPRKRRKQPARRANPAPAAAPFWRRPVGWLAGVAGLVVSALVAFLVPQLAPGWLDSAKDVGGSPVLGVTLEEDLSNLVGNTWSTPRDAGRPPVDGQDQWTVYPPDWYRGQGGLRPGTSGHRIVVENRRSGPVELLDLRPVVLERRAPLSGALYWMPAQGEVSDVALVVDLDATSPIVSDPEGNAPYFASRHQQLAKGERVVFRVVAKSARCLCLWRLTAEYQDSDGLHALTIPAEGEPPLQTTAYAPSYGAVYDGLQSGYRPVDPAIFCRGPESPCRS
jgi:hypothetical protein